MKRVLAVAAKPVGFADRHPVGAILSTTGAVYVALLVLSEVENSPILLARAEPQHRVEIYGQFASSSVALLAVALTVLAILLALPDRPALEDLRTSESWSRLQGTLLVAALLCLVTLVTAHLGAAIDDSPCGRQWLDLLMITTGAMAIISVVLGGFTFWLFLRVSQQPRDPSQGRGE